MPTAKARPNVAGACEWPRGVPVAVPVIMTVRMVVAVMVVPGLGVIVGVIVGHAPLCHPPRRIPSL